MGVYNPLLDMPVSCAECDTRGGSNCFLSNQLSYPDVLRRRHPDCPLVEVKVPHGRLIDADEAYINMMCEMCGSGYQGRALSILRSDLYSPSIIEAESAD